MDVGAERRDGWQESKLNGQGEWRCDGGWKKPKTGDEVSKSMKVTKMYDSVDENNGLEYTVGVKSLGLLSTTIDKALGGMLKCEEAQLKCSPEYAEGAIINLTLVQVAEKHMRKRFRTRLPQRKQSQRIEECFGSAGIDRESGGREGSREEGVYHEVYCRKCRNRVAAKTNSSAKTITAKQVDLSVLSKSF